MVCGNCGGQNEAGRKFCGDCGSRLAVACATCGSANPPTARFCGECGSVVGGSAADGAANAAVGTTPDAATAAGATPWPPAPHAERRVVSVLFADLVGFTAFAEGRDTEDVRETLGSYFELASGLIERYGGTVEKFIGDAVMAVWGAPTAHEDDAERAVRAALELVDAVRTLGPDLAARAGVLTGEVAVTIGAVNQGMIAGDLVNTASRVQSVAQPGTVLVGETTMVAAGRAIAFESVGPQDLKGKSSPVQAWRAMRVVAERGGRNRAEMLEAPFVGREDEIRLLKDYFHSTGRDRRLRIVSITGQAGIGKSRLAWEFEKYLDGLVEDVYWHHGRSPSIGGSLAFWALGEMVRGRFGLSETDDDSTTRIKVTAELPRWVPDEGERRWIEPALLALLGVGTEARPGHEQLFGAWRTFLERIAQQGTVVMVFEDLQWADDGLLAFVDHLAEWSRSSPILLVTLARPELLDVRPDWGAGRRHFASVPLEPLTPAAMRELLAGLVPGLPETAAEAVIARADGIPLYTVETVRMLVAEGRLVAQEDGRYAPVGDLSTLAVPSTLQSLIAARLDGLDAADRALLQAASVIGQSFTVEALAAVAPDASDLPPRLTSLVRRELLVQRVDPRSPERGQYAFVQALMREVSYSTLARADRRRLHLAAARHFETTGEEQAAGALAAQYLAAWQTSAEGPEAAALAAQARLALRAAAERAAALGSMDQAVQLLRQALEVTTEDAERVVILERAGSLATLGDRLEVAEEMLVAAGELYRASGQRSAEARVVALRAMAYSATLRAEDGLALLEEAAERFADLGDDPGRVEVLAQLSRFLMFGMQGPRAIEVADQTLPIAERLDMLPIVADVLVTRGTCLATAGREYEGFAVLEGGMKLAANHGFTTTEMRARINLSGLMGAYGVRDAVAIASDGLAIAMRLGLKTYVPNLVGNAVFNEFETGAWDEADAQLTAVTESGVVGEHARMQLDFFRVSLAVHRGEDPAEVRDRLLAYTEGRIKEGNRALEPTRLSLIVTIDHAAGRWHDAFAGVMRVGPMDDFNAATNYAWAVILAALTGDEGNLHAAVAALHATGSHGPATKLHLRIGEACLRGMAGETREALGVLTECLATARTLGFEFSGAQVALAMAGLFDPTLPEVRAPLEEARELFTRLRARPWLERAEAALAREGTATAGARPVGAGRDRSTQPAST